MKKADLFFNVLRLPVDFVMLLLAGATTYILRTKILSAFRPVLFEFNLPLVRYLYLVLFVSFVFLVIYALSGLYSMKSKMSRTEEFSKIVIASSAGILVIIITIFLRQELFNSRFLVLGGWFFAILFVFLGRLITRFIQTLAVANYDFGVHRVMLIGEDRAAKNIEQEIKNNPSYGYRIIGHISEPDLNEIKGVADNFDLDEVILADPNYPAEKITELVDFCHDNHIIFKFIPNIYQTLTKNFNVDVINEFPLIELRRTALDGWGRVIKRAIDIVAGVFSLIIFSPLFLIVSFAVKWETEGPVFVRLKRISRNKEFKLYKFRSMIKNAEELKPLLTGFNERADSPLFKMRDDPRITKVGRFIRRTRIDELPQFWNVLKGDISLVGPRPHQPDEISRYEKGHKKVLAIKAGATGLAQISGSSDLAFDKEVAMDSFYIENWSLFLDLKIILKTALKFLRDRSAV